jgi:hypothetical protein
VSDRAIEPAAASSVALAQIVGTGNTRAALERVEENVRDVIDVCRERGFVQRFDGQREFFGLPAWQLLGMTYGLLPFVEWSHPIADGFEARAVVRTVEGVDIGAAEAQCTSTEPNKRRSTDHDLRAMAQTRAMRNALRSVLGSALVLAGFDFADPDAPATRDQIKAIWTLAGRRGLDRDAAHELAGVPSMLDLTREQATELLDELEGAGSAMPANAAPQEGPPSENGGEGAVQVGAPVVVVGEGTAAAGGDPTAWNAYRYALEALPKPELAPALTRRTIRAAGLEGPPQADWPAELLFELAELLESAGGHPAGT